MDGILELAKQPKNLVNSRAVVFTAASVEGVRPERAGAAALLYEFACATVVRDAEAQGGRTRTTGGGSLY